MPLITWKDSYSTHIPEIDDQHKKLIGMVNKLHDALKAGASTDVCYDILKELVEYTDYHFKTEEKLFDKINYANKVSHKAEHDKLRAKAISHLEHYKETPLKGSLEVMAFLKDWLNHHILEVDMKYANITK